MQVADLPMTSNGFGALLERANSTNSSDNEFMTSSQPSLLAISSASTSPTDVQMGSLDSEESESSNPELENALESTIR